LGERKYAELIKADLAVAGRIRLPALGSAALEFANGHSDAP
jgi:hypothetical protein